jgi:signal transduction histidine kinase
MQERANEIGADLSVQTKGEGFSIQLTLEGDV